MKFSLVGILIFVCSVTFAQVNILGSSCDQGAINTCAFEALSRNNEASARAREANARAKQIELQNQNNMVQGFFGTAINPHPIDSARVLVNTYDVCMWQKSGPQFCNCYANKMAGSIKVADHIVAFDKFSKGEKYNATSSVAAGHQKSYIFCDQAVGFGR